MLARYSDWLLARRQEGWDVVDIHTPMKRYLESERRRNPSFRLAGDGVHATPAGHWIIAREILAHWGVRQTDLENLSRGDEILGALPHGREVLGLVTERQAVLKDAWLTATGHKRPGMAKGLPLPEAKKRAQEIDEKMKRLLAPAP